MSFSNGSRRVVRLGSWGCVQQLATIANGRLMPLKPVQTPGGMTTSEWSSGPRNSSISAPLRRRAVAVVVEHELDAAVDAGVVERHLAVLVPALDDARVDAREVDLAELDEVRIVGAQHVEDRPALVGDAPERDHVHAVDALRLTAARTSFRQ